MLWLVTSCCALQLLVGCVAKRSLPGPLITSTRNNTRNNRAMRAPVPASASDLSDRSKWRQRVAPLVVDVGANVGWFTLNAAAAGGTVAAFEGGLVVRQGCWLGDCGALPLCCSHY